MNSRSYKTKQRESLLNYLQSVPGVHVTAEEVYEHFKKSGEPIGKSTIYRRLESLVDEGKLRKYVVDGKSPACFEYRPEGEHLGEGSCFHCKCELCGKLIHLNCEDLGKIEEHLSNEHKFKLNTLRTVFYGICESCAGEEPLN